MGRANSTYQQAFFKVAFVLSYLDMENEIKELASELLELLEIKAEIEITEQDEGYQLIIDPEEEAGLLIGSHGSTLSAIQSFLSIALKQKTGDWVRLTVDIGDWRQKQNEELEELADQAAMRARETGEPQNLYNLSPGQRRIVHMALSKMKDIETESKGEGNGRYLVVTASK